MSKYQWVAIFALGLAASAAWGQSQEPSGTSIEGQPIPAARPGEDPSVDETAVDETALEDGGLDDPSDAGQSVAGPVAETRPADAFMSLLGWIEAGIRAPNTPVEDEERQRRDQRDERDERDTRARQEIAFWTMAVFWAAVGIAVLAAIALLAVLRTVWHTRRAARDILGEARATTRAAVAVAEQASRANDLAGTAAGRLNRPYVVPVIVAHNLPKYITAKSSVDRDLTASIIYKNSGGSPAILKKISPIASPIPVASEPEPLNPLYYNRDLFLDLEVYYLEPGQATKEISISCSLPQRVRELAAARASAFHS